MFCCMDCESAQPKTTPRCYFVSRAESCALSLWLRMHVLPALLAHLDGQDVVVLVRRDLDLARQHHPAGAAVHEEHRHVAWGQHLS